MAQRDLPVYLKDRKQEIEEDGENQEEDTAAMEKPISVEFSDKTNQLLEYIEKTYLDGFVNSDGQGQKIIDKMRLAKNTTQVPILVYGSNYIFWELIGLRYLNLMILQFFVSVYHLIKVRK